MRPTVVRVPPYSVMADAPGGLCCHPCSSLLCRDHLIPDLPRIALFKVLETRNGQSVGYSNESQIYFISLHNISICASVSVWGFKRYSSSSGFVSSLPYQRFRGRGSRGSNRGLVAMQWSLDIRISQMNIQIYASLKWCNDLWIYGASLKLTNLWEDANLYYIDSKATVKCKLLNVSIDQYKYAFRWPWILLIGGCFQ